MRCVEHASRGDCVAASEQAGGGEGGRERARRRTARRDPAGERPANTDFARRNGLRARRRHRARIVDPRGRRAGNRKVDHPTPMRGANRSGRRPNALRDRRGIRQPDRSACCAARGTHRCGSRTPRSSSRRDHGASRSAGCQGRRRGLHTNGIHRRTRRSARKRRSGT